MDTYPNPTHSRARRSRRGGDELDEDHEVEQPWGRAGRGTVEANGKGASTRRLWMEAHAGIGREDRVGESEADGGRK